MARFRSSVPVFVFLFVLVCAGCGGGGSSVSIAPLPPADFSIGLSTSSITIAQGAASSGISVTVTGQNGFSGSVQVSLNGLPSGVTSNPASPFQVAAGASTTVVFGAASNAATGSFTISAQGTSGNLSHASNLGLTVQGNPASPLPRTTFQETGASIAADVPAGEASHRHMVYDAAHKKLFVANRAMNCIEAFSTGNPALIAKISVAGASSVDLSSDGATVWVGTVTEQAVAIDPATLQVKARFPMQPLSPIPNTVFNRPEELLALANGTLMIRLRQTARPEALLVLWNPTANTLTNLTPAEPQLFQNGLGVMARSGDRTKVLVAASDTSGEIAIFDANGDPVAGPRGLGSGTISRVAANLDGSRYAVVLVSGSIPQLLLLDGALNPVGSPAPIDVSGLTFSRDGNFLYVARPASTLPVVMILDAHDLHTVGVVPDAVIEGVSSQIEDADETQLVFGLANRGVSFVDASKPLNPALPAPFFAPAPAAQPADGPNVGGTSATFNGQNFSALTQVNFGQQAAANFSVLGSAQIQATSPASVVNGAVNVTAYFSSGWLAIAPYAFSYGPKIIEILPNAGVKEGGDTIQIYGYGFGSDPTKVTVKIGGVNATVQKIENTSAIAGSGGFDVAYPFSLERITLQTPQGTSGKVDAVVSTSSGSTISPKSFQFLQKVQSVSQPGFYRFVVYDQKRQWLYLTNLDHVAVFDLAANQFRANIQPPGGPLPNTALRGLAMTPDGSQLVIADFGAQKVYLMSPDSGTGASVSVGGVAGFLNSGPARVAATSTQTVFVGLSGEGGITQTCSTCLGQLNLAVNPPTIQPAPQPQVTSLTGAPLVQGNATGDHVYLAFSTAPGGPLAVWDAASPNQFSTIAASTSSTDLGAAADGTMFAIHTNGASEIRGSDLVLNAVPTSSEMEQISGRVLVPGVTLHPSGALVYQPFLTGAPGTSGVRGGVDILDAHSGVLRLRIFLPQPFLTDVDGFHGSFLTTDENGQRLFALTSSDGSFQNAGITILQLASVPLGIGTVSPARGSATGGAALTIRGSGFQNGVSVSIGGKAATVTVKDSSTLSILTPALSPGPQRIVITNPDGESASLDAAFTAN